MPNIAELPPEFTALIVAGIAALGGVLPTLEEAQRLGVGEPICTVAADGAVKVSPRFKKLRRTRAQPVVRSERSPSITPRARHRAPGRRRAAGARAAESRDGPGSADSDGPPEPLTTDSNSKPTCRNDTGHGRGAITSFGHAQIFLDPHWQMMGALEALNGMMLFGLTTAFLFVLIQKIWPLGGRMHGRRD